jgi:hypothetical protein
MNPGMTPATKDELLASAATIIDDTSFETFCTVATNEGGGATFRQDYEAYAIATFGYVPLRIHNLAPGNPYNLPAGPACCQIGTLGPVPNPTDQASIALINLCVPLEKIYITLPQQLQAAGVQLQVVPL